MTITTYTDWACDRCRATVTTEARTAPTGFTQIRVSSVNENEFATSFAHLCRACLADFRGFLWVPEPEDPDQPEEEDRA